jgi:hypothetical protein
MIVMLGGLMIARPAPRHFLAVALLLSASLLSAPTVAWGQTASSEATMSAQGSDSSTLTSTPSVVTTLQETVFEGEVVRVDGDKISVKGDAETKDFPVGSGIKITRDGSTTPLADIKPADKVKVTTDNNGQVLTLEATSAERSQWQKMAIPLILGGLLLLGLLWWLFRRSQTGHIRTTPTNLG